jgi:hypothetical protein
MTEDIQRYADSQHRVFLGRMSPVFGVCKPAPARIELVDRRSPDGRFVVPNLIEVSTFGRNVDFCDSDEFLPSRKYITAHETGHYMHRLSNPDFWRRKHSWTSEDFFLAEMVAGLGAIEFVGRDHAALFFAASDWEEVEENFYWSAHRAYSEDRDFLARVLRTGSMGEAHRLVAPYRKYATRCVTFSRDFWNSVRVSEA